MTHHQERILLLAGGTGTTGRRSGVEQLVLLPGRGEKEAGAAARARVEGAWTTAMARDAR